MGNQMSKNSSLMEKTTVNPSSPLTTKMTSSSNTTPLLLLINIISTITPNKMSNISPKLINRTTCQPPSHPLPPKELFQEMLTKRSSESAKEPIMTTRELPKIWAKSSPPKILEKDTKKYRMTTPRKESSSPFTKTSSLLNITDNTRLTGARSPNTSQQELIS